MSPRPVWTRISATVSLVSGPSAASRSLRTTPLFECRSSQAAVPSAIPMLTSPRPVSRWTVPLTTSSMRIRPQAVLAVMPASDRPMVMLLLADFTCTTPAVSRRVMLLLADFTCRVPAVVSTVIEPFADSSVAAPSRVPIRIAPLEVVTSAGPPTRSTVTAPMAALASSRLASST